MQLHSSKESVMKSRALVFTLAAILLGSGCPAFAQGSGQDRNVPDPSARSDRHHQRPGWNARDDNRHRDGRDARYYYDARGPEFRRGNRIPDMYRSRYYVVDDWRGHRLSAPPRGYQWVQVGADYALVAIATGVILQLMLNR
jgi:Ni/Co efflux regulator RcnB